MCGGVKYTDSSGKEWKIYFPSPKAALPVARADGTLEWIKWGRRKEEQAPSVQGGWARPDSIKLGKWERYSPVFVQLAAHSFMEKDASKVSHWIDIPTGQAIEALMVEFDEEKRIYVVTQDTPKDICGHSRHSRRVCLGTR